MIDISATLSHKQALMPESFDLFRYLEHLCSRWMVPAIACAVAVGLALVISLLTPNQYTSTVRVLIQSPTGGLLSAPMAISPTYLESLKTYELLASGDRLFADAL